MILSEDWNRSVCEVISDYGNISLRLAMSICKDLQLSGVMLAHDDPAYLHVEDINFLVSEGLYFMLDNDSESEDPADDPFIHAVKTSPDEVDSYLSKSTCTYYCCICCSNMTGDNYRLSCGCTAYCLDCITQWITTCARCPNCRRFCQVQQAHEQDQVPVVKIRAKLRKVCPSYQ
jgi:hypothetical protein